MGVTHKAKAGALLTGTEYEAADSHVLAIADADVPATIARSSSVASLSRVIGTKVAWCGDSITYGSGSTDITVDSWRAIVQYALGARCSPASINAGVASDTSALLLARMPSILAQSPGCVVVMIGTGDASASVPVGTYAANMEAIKALVDEAGLPLVVMTVPPVGDAGGATLRSFVARYNLWLAMWAARTGVPLIDAYAALVDPSDGYYLAANTTDGTHPNVTGHAVLAQAVYAAMRDILPLPSWPVVSAGLGLLSDPLMSGTSGWLSYNIAPWPTQANVAASDGDVPYGQWVRHTLDNSGGGTAFAALYGRRLSASWTTGDTILCAGWVRGSASDVVGGVRLLRDSDGLQLAIPVKAPGVTTVPFLFAYTIAEEAEGEDIALVVVHNAGAGATTTLDTGAWDVFNLTALGLTASDLGL